MYPAVCVIIFFCTLFANGFCGDVEKNVTNQVLVNKNVTSDVQSKIEPSASLAAPPSKGREGVVSTQIIPNNIDNLTITVSDVSSKNGSITTSNPFTKPSSIIPAENVDAKSTQHVNATILLNETAISNLNMSTKPISETPSKIFPRKGVTPPESFNETHSTAAPVIKKPKITEYAESEYNQPELKSIKNINVLVPDNKEHKRAAYVVPIIAVIFSVPLVAAIISVLYKRGSEWWQHRHYRRMDFLIEGMYNN